jgi:hypothetical protein
MSTDQMLDHQPTSAEAGRATSLRVPARLILAGQLLVIAVTQLHTGGDANDHHSIFAEYAHSGDWKGVHTLQFLAVAITVTGLVALATGLERLSRQPLFARTAALLSVVSLALYGVLQAVDGIGNKQVDHAWDTAAATDKPARFASAESMRWLEWGMSSYHAYATGLALLALAAAVLSARTAGISRILGGLVVLTGLAWMGEGWVAGEQGFNALHSTFIIATWALSLVWMAWLVVSTRRTPF